MATSAPFGDGGITPFNPSSSPLPTSGNQFGPTPPLQTPQVPPGLVPQQGPPSGTFDPFNPVSGPTGAAGVSGNPFLLNLGNDFFGGTTLQPGLTNSLFNYLATQIGQGVTPFNLSSLLPSSGQATTPGTLTAPINPLMASLQSFFSGGQSNVPGTSTLSQISNGISAVPAWQQAVDAMNRNIQQQQANLKEQFGSAAGGSLVGTPFANALTDFSTQTLKDQNSLLAQMQLSTLPQQLSAATELTQGAGGLASTLQGYDQSSIQNLYNEFLRTSPQSNPLLNAIYGAATTFPPILSGKGFGVGALGGLLQGAGSIVQAIGGLKNIFSGSGNNNSPLPGNVPVIVENGGGGGGGTDPGSDPWGNDPWGGFEF